MNKEEKSFEFLKSVLDGYYPLCLNTWQAFMKICTPLCIDKHDYICRANELQKHFFFVTAGLLRVYTIDEKGVEYNKTFFEEGTFPGSMVALLKDEPSSFEIQALEKCELICIDFKQYRELLLAYDDLKLFHINYLERNWLMKTEAKEIAMIQEDASSRYDRFLEDYPTLGNRLAQYHIASHLGITPTQLSRIRKNR